MKIPMKWLSEYVSVPIAPDAYAEKMIMSGTGVEGIDYTGAGFEGVVVGRILSVRPHENSDRLALCDVDIGRGTLQVVTGAPNVKAGQLVPVAPDGAKLPGGVIKRGMLRGALSEGMLCSGPELGVPEELYPHVGDAGILIFQEDYPPGTDAKEALGLGDAVVDFEILADRPDCLSVWGIARETAATMDVPLTMPVIWVEEAGGDVRACASVTVLDAALCPRYMARVIRNVEVGPSPRWMRAYLLAAGVRPINNIVDITNFVMLETGHPMHAFDLARVRERAIVVRRAHEGETLTTLDGRAHALTPDMLVIADEERATGLAGIMGGEESEITPDTRDVLFECAAFDRTNIRLTARALGIRTESSGRFERGVTPATADEAIERACMLVNMLECGEVVSGRIDCYPRPVRVRPVRAEVSRICRRVGVSISGDAMQDILERLHFDVTLKDGVLTCTAPPWRVDIESEADISEEVLRLYGYDAIPSTLMTGVTMAGGRSEREARCDRVRAALVGMGFYEAMSYSFISPRRLEAIALPEGDVRLDPLLIKNPLGEDTSAMRTTLLPSMLEMLSLNISRANASGKLFELAPAFLKSGDVLPEERLQLALGLDGDAADFYALRDAVVWLGATLGTQADLMPGGGDYFHPGRRAEVYAEGHKLGELGEIHPDVAGNFDISRRVYVALMDMDALARAERPIDAVTPLPKYPAVTRDLALVMDEKTPIGPMVGAMRSVGDGLVESVEVFDIFRGAQLGEGKKSVAFALTLRSPDGTLTEETAGAAIDKILAICDDVYGAQLRQ